MYASVRRYQVDPVNVAALSQTVEDGFVPMIRRTAGFVAYFGVDAGDGLWISTSVFETREAAEASNRMAAGFVRERVGDLVLSGPDVASGEVVVSAINRA